MPDLSCVYELLSFIPLDCLQWRFMQQAFLAVLLLAPMASVLGVEVINFRMAFFSDAIGHSAFTGVALGLLLAVPPRLSMPLFGLLVGLGIVAVRRRSALSSDTVIGIAFSAVVAFGLAVISRAGGAARDMQRFLYGDILTITEGELAFLLILFVVLVVFQIFGYNKLLLVALNPVMARALNVCVPLWQYMFAGLLALVVMFSVWAVGVLLVTALLIVPAATARNVASSAGGMFWWALLVGTSSAIAGLILSAQEWMNTSSGATIILVACGWFAISFLLTGKHRRCI